MSGNAGSGFEEWVLKPNTNYVVSIANQANQDSSANTLCNLFWYDA